MGKANFIFGIGKQLRSVFQYDYFIYILHFNSIVLIQEYRKFQAHDNGPCICAVWHPVFPSTVFTCGWDGLIKMWQ